MFERFTDEARSAVVGAQTHARELRARRIGTVHLLLGVLDNGESGPAEVLRRHGVDTTTLTERTGGLDPEALKSVGVDLEAVRESVAATFGPGALQRDPAPPAQGHIPFTREAKGALKSALAEAKRRRHRHIGGGHIVLGVVGGDAATRRLLQEVGADPETVAQETAAVLEG
jgi:ATP-dependent Clp protease ATP-binding subunit ClpA